MRPFIFPQADGELSSTVGKPLQALLHQLLEDMQLLEAACAESEGWQEVGDVCFVAIVQLRGVRRQLMEHTGFEELLVACESALRYVRRMERALRDAAALASGEHHLAPSAAFSQVEIEVALKVRRLFSAFRRQLRPCEQLDYAATLQALRYAAGALAALIGAPDFGHVRAGDRLLFLRLQRRVLGWARNSGTIEEGQRVLSDLGTAAELLREVNRRQELRAHDEALAARLVEAPPRSGADGARWVVELAQLDGHDDELDALIAAIGAGLPSPAQLERVTAELHRIAGAAHSAAPAQAPMTK